MTATELQKVPKTPNPRILGLSFAVLGASLSYGYLSLLGALGNLIERGIKAQKSGWVVDWVNGTGCFASKACASYVMAPLSKTVFAPLVGDYEDFVLVLSVLLFLSLLGPLLLLNRRFQESASDNLKGLVLSFALGLGAGVLTHFLHLNSWLGLALLFSPALVVPKLLGRGRVLAPYNASFATQKDVADMLERKPSGRSILLGEKPEWKAFVTSRPGAQKRKELEHVLIVAPTRGGKGLHLQTQAYAWDGSLVIVDIKGEMHRMTSKHRIEKGPIFVLDPRNPVDAYDPFDDLKEEEEIRAATKLILDTGDAENKIFEDRATYAFLAIIYTCKALLKGVELGFFERGGTPAPPPWTSPVGGLVSLIALGSKELYEAITGLKPSSGGGPPFGGARGGSLSPEGQLLRNQIQFVQTTAKDLLSRNALDGEEARTVQREVLSPLEKAHRQMRSFYGSGEDEKFRESSWSILTASLQAFTSDGVLATLTKSSGGGGRLLKARYLVEGAPMEEGDEEGERYPITVYLRFPESELTATLPVLKLIELGLFSGAIRTIDSSGGFSKIPILWAFDEAGRAPVPELPNAVSTWAGRNMYALIYVQDLSQLQDAYKESGAETVLANTLQVFYTGNPNKKTAEYVSSRLGKFSAESAGYSYGEGKSESRSFTPRELIAPEEFSARTYPGATDDDVIVFPRGRPPVLAKRVTPWGLLKVPKE